MTIAYGFQNQDVDRVIEVAKMETGRIRKLRPLRSSVPTRPPAGLPSPLRGEGPKPSSGS